MLELSLPLGDFCGNSLGGGWEEFRVNCFNLQNRKGVAPTPGGHIVNVKITGLGEIN